LETFYVPYIQGRGLYGLAAIAPISMRGKMQKHKITIATLVAIGALVLSACGSSAGKTTATPTLSIEALSTSVAQTVIAQITASAPTITPTPQFTDTPEFTPTESTPRPTNTSLFQPTKTAICNNLAFVSDVTIPDGTTLAIGQDFTKTWRVQNSGVCQWTTSYKLIFSYGEAMGGKSVSIPAAVTAGQQIDLSVSLKVPNKSGKLTGVWSMVDDKSQPFGTLLTVVINVGNASPTPTGTTTLTPENTATPTETPTATP
jgi:Ig-like domain from next to BRCA1 gene